MFEILNTKGAKIGFISVHDCNSSALNPIGANNPSIASLVWNPFSNDGEYISIGAAVPFFINNVIAFALMMKKRINNVRNLIAKASENIFFFFSKFFSLFPNKEKEIYVVYFYDLKIFFVLFDGLIEKSKLELKKKNFEKNSF